MHLDPLCLALVNDLRHIHGQPLLTFDQLEKQWEAVADAATILEARLCLADILGARLERTSLGSLILCCPEPELQAAAKRVIVAAGGTGRSLDMVVGDYDGLVVYLPDALNHLFRLAREPKAV